MRSKLLTIVIHLILTILILQQANAQKYHAFPNDTASWNCLFWHQWSHQDIYLTNSKYIMLGDTNINEINYNKLFYKNTDLPLSDTFYIGGLREDSLQNIYFYPYDKYLPTPEIHFPSDTTEYLIYSFQDLEIGKVLPINEDVATIKVLEIDSVLIGNSYRKSYLIQNSFFGHDDYWIEGIGSIYDLFSSFTYIFEWQYYTLCFSDTASYYINAPFNADSCHYSLIIGTPEINSSTMEIFPNPTTSVLNIKNDNSEINKISIYNALGQKEMEIKHSTNQIDITRLKNGIYIIEIDLNGRIFREKIIKE